MGARQKGFGELREVSLNTGDRGASWPKGSTDAVVRLHTAQQMQPTAEEATRRQFDRYGVDLDVTVTGEHTVYAGFIENMSVGGLFIITHQLKFIDEKVRFCVHLPDGGAPIEGTGRVCWVRPYNEERQLMPGVGISFDDLDSEAVERIDIFLAEHEPLEFGED